MNRKGIVLRTSLATCSLLVSVSALDMLLWATEIHEYGHRISSSSGSSVFTTKRSCIVSKKIRGICSLHNKKYFLALFQGLHPTCLLYYERQTYYQVDGRKKV